MSFSQGTARRTQLRRTPGVQLPFQLLFGAWRDEIAAVADSLYTQHTHTRVERES